MATAAEIKIICKCERCGNYLLYEDFVGYGACIHCGDDEHMVFIKGHDYDEAMKELQEWYEYKNGFFRCGVCGHYQHTTEYGICEECGYEDLIPISEEEYKQNIDIRYTNDVPIIHIM